MNSHAENQINQFSPFTYILGGILLVGLMSVLTYFSGIYQIEIYVLASILGIFGLFLIIQYPKLWIVSLFVAYYFYVASYGKGISADEVISGLYFAFSSLAWIFWRTLVMKKRIIENKADWLILFFLFILFGNVVISKLNGVEVQDWVRQYIKYFSFIAYFPIRHYLKEKKDVRFFLIVGGIMASLLALGHMYNYYKTTTDIMYAYELGSTSRLNQAVFISGSIFGLIFFFQVQKFWEKILIFIFTSLSLSSLVLTLSRSFWLVYLVCSIIVFIYLTPKKKLTFVLLISSTVAFFIILAFTAFEDKANIFFNYINKRFASSSQVKTDYSMINRYREYETVLKKVKLNPLGGNGLGKKFTKYDLDVDHSTRVFNIHNGYLFLAYQIGIPLALVFFIWIFTYLYKSFFWFTAIDDPLYKSLALAGFLSLLSVITTSLTAAIFFTRDGQLTIIFSLIAVSVCYKHLYSEKK